ncbi:MAG: arylsulfatase [Planctomycetes bacterium]|nr:arylsulfatase [Planctomycetota bacterium]
MPTDKRPNILLIMTDQQRGDCLSIDGHPALLTPNMDHLAWSGTRFSRAYSTCPSCIPARRALMSGQHPATNGMVGYREGIDWNPAATLPGELEKAGYQTAIVGRTMHLYPIEKGFGFQTRTMQEGRGGHVDAYQQALRGRNPYGGDQDYHVFGMTRSHGITANGWTARPWHLDESLHPTTWTVTEALKFLRRRDTTRPFFLVVSFIAPHPPLVPPGFYMERYLRMDLPAPAIGDWAVPPPNGGLGLAVDSHRVNLRGEALRSAQAGYYGLINHVDDQLCRLFMEMNAARDLANTVTALTSDHGEMLGDHYLFRKCFPFEGSARIPLMMSGPRDLGFRPEQLCDRPVCLEDLMPTFLELAGHETPPSVEGRSLVPWLRGDRPGDWREYLHGEHATCYHKEQANHYLTDGREKYVWMTELGTELLFDLKNDPGELRNLAAQPAHAQRTAAWRGRLIEQLRNRPEGFTDGSRLISARPYDACLPHARGGSPNP